jgi:hypothetical protein
MHRMASGEYALCVQGRANGTHVACHAAVLVSSRGVRKVHSGGCRANDCE